RLETGVESRARMKGSGPGRRNTTRGQLRPAAARSRAASGEDRPMRRVVTGHSGGKSVFLSDGPPPRVVTFGEIADLEFNEIWATEVVPALPAGSADPTASAASFAPPPGGTRFRIVQFPPDVLLAESLLIPGGAEAFAEEEQEKLPGFVEAMEPGDPGMHTTDTIDYAVVLSGEITLELDDGATVHLRPGDCVVQQGTRHAWRNHTSQPCTIAFILVGAERRDGCSRRQ